LDFSLNEKSMKKLFTSLLIVSLCQVAFSQQKEFSWLLGKWKMKDKSVFEQWKTDADGKTLVGQSYRVKERETILMEEIRFTFSDNSFHYIPEVAGDQGPVDFTITQHSVDGFVAENPKHDFPKLIRYKFIRKDGKDWIEASIEGDGKVIPYQFERVE
jgi:hypothetical protein